MRPCFFWSTRGCTTGVGRHPPKRGRGYPEGGRGVPKKGGSSEMWLAHRPVIRQLRFGCGKEAIGVIELQSGIHGEEGKEESRHSLKMRLLGVVPPSLP